MFRDAAGTRQDNVSCRMLVCLVVWGPSERRTPRTDASGGQAESARRGFQHPAPVPWPFAARPAWLANGHAKLDAAVAAAYGWPSDLSDSEILERLLALNLERANSLVR